MSLEWVQWWQAGDWVVRGVALCLLGMSLLSWSLILLKTFQFYWLGRKERGAARLLAAATLPVEGGVLPRGSVAEDLRRLASTASSLPLEERLEAALARVRVRLEGGLTVLASIGSAAPFIGLLGTVWGIMHALVGLDGSRGLSLDTVAGPVGEALVATALGLFTAIPAVVAYNLLVRGLRRLGLAMAANGLRLRELNAPAAPAAAPETPDDHGGAED